jgi:Ras GTPase-activating-like protein IQGAP2/3
VLERDVRYLDSRIALLIQNRMALDEQNEFAARIEDAMDTKVGQFPDDRRVQVTSHLMMEIDDSNMEICFTYCRLSRDISRLFVVW